MKILFRHNAEKRSKSFATDFTDFTNIIDTKNSVKSVKSVVAFFRGIREIAAVFADPQLFRAGSTVTSD